MQALLNLGDGLAGIEALGARLRAVHDGLAAVQFVGVIQRCQALCREVIATVDDPPAIAAKNKIEFNLRSFNIVV